MQVTGTPKKFNFKQMTKKSSHFLGGFSPEVKLLKRLELLKEHQDDVRSPPEPDSSPRPV